MCWKRSLILRSHLLLLALFSVAAAKGINYKQPFSAAVLRKIHSFPFKIVSFSISFCFFTLEEGAFFSQEGETSVKFAIAFLYFECGVSRILFVFETTTVT